LSRPGGNGLPAVGRSLKSSGQHSASGSQPEKPGTEYFVFSDGKPKTGDLWGLVGIFGDLEGGRGSEIAVIGRSHVIAVI